MYVARFNGTFTKTKFQLTVMSSKSVYAVFSSRACAANALDELKAAEFTDKDLKILYSPASNQSEVDKAAVESEFHSTSVGLTTGAMFGALTGLISGIILTPQLLPGLSSIIMAGPVLLAIIGAGVEKGLGGMTGALVGKISSFKKMFLAALMLEDF